MREPDHIPALDGVRGIAILLVMLSHLHLGVEATPADRVTKTILLFGYSGVDLFFVLSGFLITGILLDSRGSAHFFRNFYMRRVLRIFPLYYGFLVVLLVMFPLLKQPPTAPLLTLLDNQWWYWLHATNVLWGMGGSVATPYNTGHFWSLAVEEQFYLLWPLVVSLCVPRTLLRVCIACIAGAVLVRMAINLVLPGSLVYTLMPARMDTLAIGGALAVIAREPRGLKPFLPIARRVALASAAITVVTYVPFQRIGSHASVLVYTTIGYSAVALMYGALLVLALHGTFAARVSNPFLRFFGKYSYGLYVINWPLLLFVDPVARLARRAPLIFGWSGLREFVFFALVSSLAVGLAMLSWHVYEKPILSLRRHFRSAASGRDHESRSARRQIDADRAAWIGADATGVAESPRDR